MVFGEDIGDGIGPFENDDGIILGERLGEVIDHEAGVVEAVKIVVNEFGRRFFVYRGGASVSVAIFTRARFVGFWREKVVFTNGERGGGDGCFDAETFGEMAGEGGFAGTDVAD